MKRARTVILVICFIMASIKCIGCQANVTSCSRIESVLFGELHRGCEACAGNSVKTLDEAEETGIVIGGYTVDENRVTGEVYEDNSTDIEFDRKKVEYIEEDTDEPSEIEVEVPEIGSYVNENDDSGKLDWVNLVEVYFKQGIVNDCIRPIRKYFEGGWGISARYATEKLQDLRDKLKYLYENCESIRIGYSGYGVINDSVDTVYERLCKLRSDIGELQSITELRQWFGLSDVEYIEEIVNKLLRNVSMGCAYFLC